MFNMIKTIILKEFNKDIETDEGIIILLLHYRMFSTK